MAKKRKKKTQSDKKGASGAGKSSSLRPKGDSTETSAVAAKWPDYLAYFAIAALVFGALPFILRSIYAISYPFTINYSEDSFLVSALELAAGRNPYAPYQYREIPYILSPYPPVYYMVVAALNWITGPSITPGRVASVISSLGISVFIFMIIRRETKNLPGAVIGAIAYFTLFPTYLWGMMHRVDNMSLLLAVAGLYAGTAGGASNRRLILTGALLLLSIYTKQNSVAALGVVTFCLWGENKKRAVLFAGIFVASWLAIFGFLNLISEGGYYYCTVSSLIKPITWDRFAWLTKIAFSRPPKIFMLAAVGTALASKWIRLDRWILYLGMTLTLGLATIGKSGSGPNYFMESSMALATVFGITSARLITRAKNENHWAWIPVSFLLVAAMLMGMGSRSTKNFTKNQWVRITNYSKRIEAFKADDLVLKYTRPKDMILTKWVDMAVLLDRVPIMNDPRGFGLLAGEMWDETLVLKLLREESIPLVITDVGAKSLMKSEYFSQGVKKEISKHYKYMGSKNGIFFYLPNKRVRRRQ